jgi:hypothetical protein
MRTLSLACQPAPLVVTHPIKSVTTPDAYILNLLHNEKLCLQTLLRNHVKLIDEHLARHFVTSSSTGGLSPRPTFHSSHNVGIVVTVLSNPYCGAGPLEEGMEATGSVGALSPTRLDSATVGQAGEDSGTASVRSADCVGGMTIRACTWICTLPRRSRVSRFDWRLCWMR